MGPVPHFDPRPSRKIGGPWEGQLLQPIALVSIPAVPGHERSRNGDGCMPPAIAEGQDEVRFSLMVSAGWENTTEPESENWIVHGGLLTVVEPYSMSLRY